MPLVHRSPTQRLVNLVAALGGQWHGHSAVCRCPAHADTRFNDYCDRKQLSCADALDRLLGPPQGTKD